MEFMIYVDATLMGLQQIGVIAVDNVIYDTQIDKNKIVQSKHIFQAFVSLVTWAKLVQVASLDTIYVDHIV